MNLVFGVFFVAIIICCIVVIYVYKDLLRRKDFSDKDIKIVNVRVEAYKTISQIVGGVAVLAGLVLTMYQLLETQRQYEQTVTNQEEQRRQVRESFSLRRFEKAIANLESNIATSRTSGVITINTIATEYPDTYKKIADDVLMEYVRNGLSHVARMKYLKNGGVWPSRDKFIAIELLAKRLDENNKEVNYFNKIDFTDAFMPYVNVSGLVFNESNFSRGNFRNSKFVGVKIYQSNLNEVDFRGGDLTSISIRNSDLRNADFVAAILIESSFDDSNLAGVKFTAANMNNVSLKNTDLSGARFTGAKMNDVDFSGANLSDVELLTQSDIDFAKGDQFTKLPRTLKRPDHWK